MRRLATLFLLVFVVAGCRKDAPKEEGSKTAEAPSRKAEVAIVVDGTAVSTVDPGEASTYAPLAAFLPAGRQELDTWSSIELVAGTRREVIDAPAEKYPGLVAALFP